MTQNSSNNEDKMLEKVVDIDIEIQPEIQHESIVNMDHDFLSLNKLDWHINGANGNLMHGGTFL